MSGDVEVNEEVSLVVVVVAAVVVGEEKTVVVLGSFVEVVREIVANVVVLEVVSVEVDDIVLVVAAVLVVAVVDVVDVVRVVDVVVSSVVVTSNSGVIVRDTDSVTACVMKHSLRR